MSELGLPAFGGAEPALLSHVALGWRLAGRASNTRLTTRSAGTQGSMEAVRGPKTPIAFPANPSDNCIQSQ
jgi:hypothetical protein